MNRKFSIKIAGIPVNNQRYSGRLSCNYLYITPSANFTFTDTKETYEEFLGRTAAANTHPVVFNYEVDANSVYEVSDAYLGLYHSVTAGGTNSSFYRRQYDVYKRLEYNEYSKQCETVKYEYIGEWEPVMLYSVAGVFRDFNIKSGHSYQYVMYPEGTIQKVTYAKDRTKQDLYDANLGVDTLKGDVIHVEWGEWSLTELIPTDNIINDAPILKKTYIADLDNIWLFKYEVDVGSQKQNLVKNQVNTLGQYPRIAHGAANNISGSVTCMLGSEIVPYSKNGYIERMWRGIQTPLSTNERAHMLKMWRKFAFSKNPKLLKDTKGQSWIVSVIDSENTPMNSVYMQPDKISFSWVEIESTKSIVIYSGGEGVERAGGASSIWESTTK